MPLPTPLSPELAEALADRFRLLAEPTRLRLLDLMSGGERSVGELAEAIGCTTANVSKHLALMADAGIVVRRRSGLHSYYAVADTAVFELCGQVCESLRRVADARAAALRDTA
ncbi:MAG TPA: metalloregulator ArsR/SmtB family transcription factor [Gaiellales bacterium]|jgi:DNA-binding transcriptional ArsR family regulator|nr:metalloregulator ArsR/SmtB family transcription factor [Gaiellales bacterium]